MTCTSKVLMRTFLAFVVSLTLALGTTEVSGAFLTRDSANFDGKFFEGDAVPTGVHTVAGGDITYGNISDWSVDGSGNYMIAQDGTGGRAGRRDDSDPSIGFSAANGWTAETRLKLTANPTGVGALQIQWRGPGTNQDVGIFIDEDNGDMVIRDQDVGGNPIIVGGFDINEFHTIRFAVEGSGGDDEIKLYVDGVDTGVLPALSNSAGSRAVLGDGTSLIVDGTTLVDYFRWDTTGGFAPIPEPSTLVLLLGCAVLLAIFRRR